MLWQEQTGTFYYWTFSPAHQKKLDISILHCRRHVTIVLQKMNTAKWWRTLDLQTFMRWLDNSDVFADTGVLIRERFPSWMQMQEYTSYAEATWNKKVIQTYNECIVRSYGDPDKYVPTFNCLGLVDVLLNLVVNTIADCPAMSFVFVCWMNIQMQIRWGDQLQLPGIGQCVASIGQCVA